MSNIEISQLTKTYNGTDVLCNVSMTLESGKCYGLVGRNGSGKTMLLKHILGFVRATRGSVRINGKIIGKEIEIPDNVGAIIETPGFLPGYSGYRNLAFLAMIKGKAGKVDIVNAMKLVGLDPSLKKPVGKYSLGMKQRLGLAQALMEQPEILLLDEPMNGLDNEGVEEMRRVLLRLKEEGRLLIIASHNREDIALLCDEIYQFDKGMIIGVENKTI